MNHGLAVSVLLYHPLRPFQRRARSLSRVL